MKPIQIVCLTTLLIGMHAGRAARALPPLFSENFDSLPLNRPVDEEWPFSNAFTHDPPRDWTRFVNPRVAGLSVTEWRGWSFANKDFWTDIEVSGGGGRQLFDLGKGTIAVADPDEWDYSEDPSPFGFYSTLLETPEIDLTPAGNRPLKLIFDSSWRGGFGGAGNTNQTAVLTMHTDVGPVELFRWESAPSSMNFKEDALNERILIDLREWLPVGATEASFEFETSKAGGDDGWWGFDNMSVNQLSTILGDMNINDVLDLEDFAAFALGLRSTSAYRALYFGEFPVIRGSTDSIFDFDDIPWFLDTMEQGGVLPSAAGAALLRAQLGVPEPSAMLLTIIGMANLWAAFSFCRMRRRLLK